MRGQQQTFVIKLLITLVLHKSVGSIQYPSSLMGMMALLRQMYLDLDWYKMVIHLQLIYL
jgi:hypothetical protein